MRLARPRPLAAAELALAAALALVAVQAFHGWSSARARARDSLRFFATPAVRPGDMLGRIGGVDLRGYDLSSSLIGGHRTVAFLIRGSSGSADLQLWENVARQLTGDPRVGLIGLCEAAACAGAGDMPRDLTLLQASEVRSTRAVLQYDVRGEALLTAANGQLVRLIRWRSSSPTRVAAEIVAAQ